MRELKGITVTHAVPGRVRLKIPRVKKNPDLARQAQERLSQVPGIQGVEANPATGSLLILYDLAMLASVETLGPLGAIFGELFPEVALEELAVGLQELMAAGGEAHTAGGLLDMINPGGNPGFNLNLLLPLTLVFLGGRSLLASKETGFPSWYDYLWFGVGALVMLSRRGVAGAPESTPIPPDTKTP